MTNRDLPFQRMECLEKRQYGWDEGLMYWVVCILAFVGCLYSFLAVAIGRLLKDETDELFE